MTGGVGPVTVVGVAEGVVWAGLQVGTVVEGVCWIVVWLTELVGVSIVGVTVSMELEEDACRACCVGVAREVGVVVGMWGGSPLTRRRSLSNNSIADGNLDPEVGGASVSAL